MLASYAVVLRRSAIAAAPVAIVMIALSVAIGGHKGLVAALLAVALVIAFFGISAVVVGFAGRHGPQAMMVAAIATYLAKILVLLFLVGQFQNSTAFNPRLFGLTVIVCVLAYSAAQMVSSMRLKTLYVEPDRDR
jgi:ATP synthase protein I